MNSSSREIKRVGKSGQISLGKQLAGRYYREEVHDDGTITLVPIAVLSTSHWSIRDRDRITNGLEWTARHPPKETDVEALEKRARTNLRQRRGR